MTRLNSLQVFLGAVLVLFATGVVVGIARFLWLCLQMWFPSLRGVGQ